MEPFKFNEMQLNEWPGIIQSSHERFTHWTKKRIFNGSKMEVNMKQIPDLNKSVYICSDPNFIFEKYLRSRQRW